MQTEEYSLFFRPAKVGCLWRSHKSVSLSFSLSLFISVGLIEVYTLQCSMSHFPSD